MPITNPTPQFSSDDAQRLGREVFGLACTAAALPSERDQNFAMTSISGERFVLKIAKADEERATLAMQHAALEHAAGRAPGLALPRVIATSSGADIVTIHGASGEPYFMRLLTWVDGTLFLHALPHDETLLASLGAALAELDCALEDFSHPAMYRELHWDLKRAQLALTHLPLLPASQRNVVRQFMDTWAGIEWGALRHSVIHGDANDYNVLVRAGRVVGLLDFGDMVHSAVVCDLAIALAYALLDQRDPLAAAGPIIRAYHAGFPLAAAEIEALYPLMATRLCMSLCYAAYNAEVKQGDAYQLVTAEPAWTLLQHLVSLPEDAAPNAFRRACQAK